jgi:hypothetical protein
MIDIKMITPNQLLQMSNAPKKINYLSIDTEGLELEILEQFPFHKYEVNFVTCEHNFELDYLEKIDYLMESLGFKRVMKLWSAQDAWYVSTNCNEKF